MNLKKECDFENLKIRLIEISQNSSKLRASKKRENILKAICQSDKHLSAEEIYFEVKKEYEPQIGLATIYRTLVLFEEFGLVNSIMLKDSSKRYEINYNTPHNHIICTKCGRVDEFLEESIERSLKEVAKNSEYVFQSKSLKIFGICKKCQ